MSLAPKQFDNMPWALTYNERIFFGCSTTTSQAISSELDSSDKSFFIPKNELEANTPLGLLSGRISRDEVMMLRSRGAIPLTYIGEILTGGKPLFMSLEPLTEDGHTASDLVLGEPVPREEDGRIIFGVRKDPRDREFKQRVAELSPQKPVFFDVASVQVEGYTPAAYKK